LKLLTHVHVHGSYLLRHIVFDRRGYYYCDFALVRLNGPCLYVWNDLVKRMFNNSWRYNYQTFQSTHNRLIIAERTNSMCLKSLIISLETKNASLLPLLTHIYPHMLAHRWKQTHIHTLTHTPKDTPKDRQYSYTHKHA